MDNSTNEDQFKIQEELLELAIKAGRRLMHDFNHMLNEVPESCSFKQMYRERGKHWETIFYPDDGMKNYRARLHMHINELEHEIERKNKLLIDNNIDPNPDLPF